MKVFQTESAANIVNKETVIISDTFKELSNVDIMIPILPPFKLLVWPLPKADTEG